MPDSSRGRVRPPCDVREAGSVRWTPVSSWLVRAGGENVRRFRWFGFGSAFGGVAVEIEAVFGRVALSGTNVREATPFLAREVGRLEGDREGLAVEGADALHHPGEALEVGFAYDAPRDASFRVSAAGFPSTGESPGRRAFNRALRRQLEVGTWVFLTVRV